MRSSVKWLTVLLVSIVPIAAAATNSLSLATYNIHAGFPMGTNSGNYRATQQDVRNIADVLTTASADIIGLQEVHCEFFANGPEKRQVTSAVNQARLLAALTDMQYVFGSTLDDARYAPNTGYLEWGTVDHWTNNDQPHGEYGNALLSRYKFVTPPENIALPRRDPDEQRACLRVELDPSEPFGSRVIVYNTHLHHQGAEARHEQLEMLLGRAASEPKDAVVFLIGDLNWRGDENRPRDAALLQEMLKRFGFHDLGAASGHFTFPASQPNRRIDYILCNRVLPVLKARVVPGLASDHLALVIRVEMPE